MVYLYPHMNVGALEIEVQLSFSAFLPQNVAVVQLFNVCLCYV